MNEEDYEVDESGTKKKHRGCLSVDDTMSLNDPDKKKKAKKRPRSPPSPRTKRKGLVNTLYTSFKISIYVSIVSNASFPLEMCPKGIATVEIPRPLPI